jgi:hypothetical protein
VKKKRKTATLDISPQVNLDNEVYKLVRGRMDSLDAICGGQSFIRYAACLYNPTLPEDIWHIVVEYLLVLKVIKVAPEPHMALHYPDYGYMEYFQIQVDVAHVYKKTWENLPTLEKAARGTPIYGTVGTSVFNAVRTGRMFPGYHPILDTRVYVWVPQCMVAAQYFETAYLVTFTLSRFCTFPKMVVQTVTKGTPEWTIFNTCPQ